MKKIFRIVRQFIVFIVAAVIIYGILGNISSQSNTIYKFTRYSNFVVLTGSMEPGISPGDYITITKINPDELKVNDIVTYKINQTVVTHQIISIEGDKIITQGTANNVADNPITKADILGKYLFKLPKIGYIMAFLSSTAGLILIIGIVIIIAFWELSDPERVKNKVKNNETKYSEEEYAEFLEFKKLKEHQEKDRSTVKTEAVAETINSQFVAEKRISRKERFSNKH